MNSGKTSVGQSRLLLVLGGALILTIFFGLMTIGVGNAVTVFGAGMGCGDEWPKCNGQWIPDLSNLKVLLEWGHRVIAGSFGLFLFPIFLASWTIRVPERIRLSFRRCVFLALIIITVQILLGAVVVLMALPNGLVFLHLVMGMGILFPLSFLLVRIMQARRSRPLISISDPERSRLYNLTAWGLTLLFLQIIAGGLLRQGAERVPGELFPAPGLETVLPYLHRGFGLAITLFVLYLLYTGMKKLKSRSLKTLLIATAFLVLLQVAIGVLAVLYPDPFLLWTTIHLVLAGSLVLFFTMLLAELDPLPANPDSS